MQQLVHTEQNRTSGNRADIYFDTDTRTYNISAITFEEDGLHIWKLNKATTDYDAFLRARTIVHTGNPDNFALTGCGPELTWQLWTIFTN